MDREGVVRDFEARLRRPDGTVRWVSDSARAVRDGQGQVLYYEGSVEDITERKTIEQQLRLQSTALEAAANGIVITDIDDHDAVSGFGHEHVEVAVAKGYWVIVDECALDPGDRGLFFLLAIGGIRLDPSADTNMHQHDAPIL